MVPGSIEYYALFETAIGTCGVAWSERGLTRLQLPESDRHATEGRLRKAAVGGVPAPGIEALINDVQHYLAGERTRFAAVPLDLSGVTPFDRRVYAAIRALDWGETASYGEIARRIGAPETARAVGQALAHNPIPIVIPCHRVLASGHRIGGFSAHGGAATKERLLELEGVRLRANEPLLPGI
jgi:methylated-DNA-[protein]-cysteine S-methyltransferase